MTVLTKLDLFWLHSDCPTRVKIIALDAIIRAKLLYGLESAQLGEEALKKLDISNLKTMRKVLGMKTTYVARDNTNKRVYEEANKKVKEQGGKKEIVTFRVAYEKAKQKR